MFPERIWQRNWTLKTSFQRELTVNFRVLENVKCHRIPVDIYNATNANYLLNCHEYNQICTWKYIWPPEAGKTNIQQCWSGYSQLHSIIRFIQLNSATKTIQLNLLSLLHSLISWDMKSYPSSDVLGRSREFTWDKHIITIMCTTNYSSFQTLANVSIHSAANRNT